MKKQKFSNRAYSTNHDSYKIIIIILYLQPKKLFTAWLFHMDYMVHILYTLITLFF